MWGFCEAGSSHLWRIVKEKWKSGVRSTRNSLRILWNNQTGSYVKVLLRNFSLLDWKMLNRFNILFWKIGRDIPKSGTQSFNSMEASKLLNFLNGDVSKGFILEKNRMIVKSTAIMIGHPFHRTHFQSWYFIIRAFRRIFTARLRQPLNASNKKNWRQNRADPISWSRNSQRLDLIW